MNITHISQHRLNLASVTQSKRCRLRLAWTVVTPEPVPLAERVFALRWSATAIVWG